MPITQLSTCALPGRRSAFTDKPEAPQIQRGRITQLATIATPTRRYGPFPKPLFVPPVVIIPEAVVSAPGGPIGPTPRLALYTREYHAVASGRLWVRGTARFPVRHSPRVRGNRLALRGAVAALQHVDYLRTVILPDDEDVVTLLL